MSLLEVRNLTTAFQTGRGEINAIEDVSFSVEPGEILGIVGESGSGKSVTALTIMGLLPRPPARVAQGSVWFDGQELTGLAETRMERIRGKGISMVFQEPMTSLDPVFTVGRQLTETVLAHRDVSREAAARLSVEMLRKVRIPEPERRMAAYPHELSGGMRQRVMIAIALLCRPDLLIADEPTTALDVTTQAQILDLIRELRAELGMAVLLITHALGVVAEMADRVAVMYAGRIVELADVETIFASPRHPYTAGLLASIPDLVASGERLATIPGTVPNLLNPPPGCRFWPRCPRADTACRDAQPPLVDLGAGHLAACWKAA